MATLTRAAAESQLVRRAGKIMVRVGLDGTTQNGTNVDLNDPIRMAVRYMGLAVADAITVVDADVAPIIGWAIEQFLDLAEFRLFQSIWGNWAEVSQSISLGKYEAQQLADRIQLRIADLENRLRKPYGPNVGAVAVGAIALGQYIPNDPGLNPPTGNTGQAGQFGPSWQGGYYW